VKFRSVRQSLTFSVLLHPMIVVFLGKSRRIFLHSGPRAAHSFHCSRIGRQRTLPEAFGGLALQHKYCQLNQLAYLKEDTRLRMRRTFLTKASTPVPSLPRSARLHECLAQMGRRDLMVKEGPLGVQNQFLSGNRSYSGAVLQGVASERASLRCVPAQ